MPRWPRIYVDLPGFRADCIHTKVEFMRIIQRNPELMIQGRPVWEITYRRRRGDRTIPYGKLKRNDVNGWMALLDARWI